MIEDPEGRICISYYSQHAYHMGVLPLPSRFQPHPDDTAELLAADDVYSPSWNCRERSKAYFCT